MKVFNVVVGLIALAAIGVAAWQASLNRSLQQQLAATRAEVETLKSENIAKATAESSQRDTELERLRREAQDVAKLRAEVTQLRTTAKEIDTLRSQNQQLRAATEQARSAAAAAPASSPPATPAVPEVFDRSNWAFSGYATPHAALVSAIWAMREGKPRTYMESLSPEEQARVSQSWANKSETEIATKQQSDVAKITSIRVLDQQQLDPDQITMNVFISGVDRLEKVSVKRIGNDWKFGGFVRDPKQ